MSVARLQESIRRSKTPVALVLGPDEARMHPKYLKSFTDMYGDCRETAAPRHAPWGSRRTYR